MSQSLTESEREALVIRWRRTLILGLIDFFNGTNDFGKLIVKELVDMRESVIKAYAKNLGISLYSGNRWRKLDNILNDIINHPNVSEEVKNKLKEINNFFTSRQFSFQQISFSLKDLRNEETHYLNLSDFPRETVIRVWRKFYELISSIDPGFLEYTKERPELKDFYFLQDFFKKAILDIKRNVSIDLMKLKERKLKIEIGRNKTKEIRLERDLWEIIEEIKKGNY